MSGVLLHHPLPIPRGWPRRVRSAVGQVISLAGASMAATRGWASESMNPALRRRAEVDRLQQEIRLLREEMRIKDARMQHIEAQNRPHYPPKERLAILELRAARSWSLAQTARTFPRDSPHHPLLDGAPRRGGGQRSRSVTGTAESVPRVRRLPGPAAESALPHDGESQDRPGRRPCRSASRADDGPPDVARDPTTGAPTRPGCSASHAHRPEAERPLARRPDDRFDRARLLDLVGPQATGSSNLPGLGSACAWGPSDRTF